MSKDKELPNVAVNLPPENTPASDESILPIVDEPTTMHYVDTTAESVDKAEERKARRARLARERRARVKSGQLAAMTSKDREQHILATQALIDRNEKILSPALAETFGLITDAVALFALEDGDPRFGDKRCERLGYLWASVLAPYMDADMARWLPVVIASTATAAGTAAWAKEIRVAREKRKRPKPPQPKPAIVEQPPTEYPRVGSETT